MSRQPYQRRAPPCRRSVLRPAMYFARGSWCRFARLCRHGRRCRIEVAVLAKSDTGCNQNQSEDNDVFHGVFLVGVHGRRPSFTMFPDVGGTTIVTLHAPPLNSTIPLNVPGGTFSR